MALLVCPDCGGSVSSRAPNCPHCGCPVDDTFRPATSPPHAAPASPAGRPQSGVTPTSSAPPRVSSSASESDGSLPEPRPLEIIAPGGISTIPLDRTVTIGRTRANIVVEHQDVAPTHCRVEPHADGWRIVDLGDKGVFVGGRRTADVVLRPGELADLGGFPGAVALAPPKMLDEPVPLKLTTPDGPPAALVLLRLPMLVGRAPWVDLPLPDRNVSQVHARLRLESGRVVVDDLQSRNGTWVNGERVRTSRELHPGDQLVVGETSLRFGDPGVSVPAAEPTRSSDPHAAKPVPATQSTPPEVHSTPPDDAPPPARIHLPEPPASPTLAAAALHPSNAPLEVRDESAAPAWHPASNAALVTPGPTHPTTLGDVVIPSSLSVEQLALAPDQYVHVPPVRHDVTQRLRTDLDACPSCGETSYLAAAGVLTGALRLAAGFVGGRLARGHVGRCSSCGARLSACPECGVSNGAPSLFEKLGCRGCGNEFLPG